MLSRSLLRYRPPASWCFSRPVSISAADLKAGDVLDHEGSLLRVEALSISLQGQRKPVVQTSLRNVRTGAKKDMRLRVDDSVEKADMEVVKYLRVLYVEGGTVAVMNNSTFDQMELPAALLGDRAPFLRDGMELQVESYKGTPLVVVTPEKCEVAVVEVAEPPAGRADKNSYDLDAVMENGLRVKVPKHIKAGDVIVVSLVEGKVGTYISKGEKAR